MVSWRLRLFWALVLGVAAALAVWLYLGSVDPTVDVVVARVVIPARTVISADQLAVKTVSRRDAAALLTHPISEPTRAIGAVAVQEIAAGQPLQDSPQYLHRASQAKSGGNARLSYFLPDGTRAATILVDEAALVGGQVHENDHIDVIFTSRDNNTGGVYSAAIIQAATVLRLQRSAGGQGTQYEVTLLVTPEQALALALGKHEGYLDVALTPPGTRPIEISPLSPLQFLQPPERWIPGRVNLR